MRLILDNLVYETDNRVLIEKYKAMGAVVEEISSTEKTEEKVDTKSKQAKSRK